MRPSNTGAEAFTRVSTSFRNVIPSFPAFGDRNFGDLTGASFVGALCARTDFAKAKGVASARFGHGTCSEYVGAAPRRAYIPPPHPPAAVVG